MAFGRGEEDTFLYVVKELAIALLGFAAISNVFQHVYGLQTFIERTVDARTGNQICALQNRMQVFVRFIFTVAKRTRLWRIRSNGDQGPHAEAYQLRGTHADKL